jgi:benzoyl-CoA reductase/2-hydroxyglutaryl-CoA dehydratase subunit BcrC/BadD/HgdB
MELFEAQKELRPPLKGSELLTLCLEEMTSSKGLTTGKIQELAERLNASDSSRSGSPRMLVMGNRVDRPDLFQMVEAAGASVVAFDTCLGLGHYSGFVENGRDPLEEIARRYLLKPSCARMPGLDERIERVERLVQDYSIDGIIYSNLKFCDYGLFDAPVIKSGLGDRSVPFLTLDNDYFWGDEGRVKTRIEAFVETIETETT